MNKFNPIIIVVFLVLAGCSQVYAQATSSAISGPTSVTANNAASYTVIFRNSSGQQLLPPDPIQTSWFIPGSNTATNMSDYSCDIYWTSTGTNLLRHETYTADNYFLATLTVRVSATPPAVPSTTFTNVQNCGNTVVTRNSNPPATDDWYWQTSATGTSTSLGNASSITQTASGALYLRARNKSTQTWSTTSQSAGTITVAATTPSVPATAVDGHVISNMATAVSLSVSAASGATSYSWYLQSSGGTALATTASPAWSPSVSQTTTYWVGVANGPCVNTSRKQVVAYVHPEPVVTITNNATVSMGVPVTLSVNNYSYDSYAWLDGNNNAIAGATAATYTTSVVGTYKVRVLRGNAPAYTSGAQLITGGLTGVDMNYIVSNSIQVPGIVEGSAIDALTVHENSQVIQYFDGLGRPIQTVATQGSPSEKDIVQPVVYDAYGREVRKYLPYVSTELSGRYKANPVGTSSPQQLFYNEGGDEVVNDLYAYAETVFEPSPMNRVLKQGAPGQAWQPGGGDDHTVKKRYEFNKALEVILFAYDATTGMLSYTSNGVPNYYAARELFANVTMDEHNNEVIEFIDKEDRTVLKKAQYKTEADGTKQYAETYYIYNDFGDLAVVLPPEGVKSLMASGVASFDNWAFQYRYDARRRMIQKKVPGADWVYMVYDDRDRLVMTQDGNQRSKSTKEWLFTKYDVLNRPVLTGIYKDVNSLDQAGMQTKVNLYYAHLTNSQAWFESYVGAGGTVHGYDNKSFPQVNVADDYLTVTYYDDYTFAASWNTEYSYLAEGLSQVVDGRTYAQPDSAFARVTGQVTGTKVKNLGDESWLRTVNYYDDRYRMVQNIMSNHMGGIDRISNVYDFAGKILKTATTHTKTNAAGRRIERYFTYDLGGRLLETYHQVDAAGYVLLSKNIYNELGQLITKKLYSTDGNKFKQHIDYRYNIRGWLTRMNDASLAEDRAGDPRDLFGMNLLYNDSDDGLSNNSLYNGNISAMRWSTNLGLGDPQNNQPAERGYIFDYDTLNRLKSATHFIKKMNWTSSVDFHEKELCYDLNGNIKKLTRTSVNGSSMDILSYDYGQGINQSNKLLSVTDAGDVTKGFSDGNISGPDYSYDLNGNMTMDKNKGVATIAYNYLNLPAIVTKSTGEYIKYSYDAGGRKLCKEVYDASGVPKKRSDYVGEFFYENDTLKFINHEEGRIVMTGAVPEYQYHMKDHLGNVRLTFTTQQQTDEYKATLEPAREQQEAADFPNYNNLTLSPVTIYNHTQQTGATWSVVLNGAPNKQVGLAKSMKVVPGDTIDIEVYAKYFKPSGTSENVGTAIAQAMTSAFGLTSTGSNLEWTAYDAINSMFNPGWVLDQTDWEYEDAPKAFLNYILFDEDYIPYDMGFDQISTGASAEKNHYDYLTLQARVRKAGYVYIYISNENNEIIEVYFDDLDIKHKHSQVMQAEDYYSFGLTFNSYRRENGLTNQHLYTGKENQDELDLGWLDYGARMYMPEIGRWVVADKMMEIYPEESPYVYAGNSPIAITDIGGYFKIDAAFTQKYPTLTKMVKYYLPMLKDNPVVKKGFMDATGFNEKQFDEMVSYGYGPWLTPTEPEKANWMDQNNPAHGSDSQFDPRFPDDLFLAKDVLERLELKMAYALSNKDGREVPVEMFYVSLTIMHEAAHYGVFHHYGLDEMLRRDAEREQGAEWERLTYRQFSYTTGVSAMKHDEVKQYFNEKIRRINGRGMTVSYENWFNVSVLTGPTPAGQNRRKIKQHRFAPGRGEY